MVSMSTAPEDNRSRKRMGAVAGLHTKKKRRGKGERHGDEEEEIDYELDRGLHPFGVKPLGNFFFDQAEGAKSCREEGLGLFAQLSDELLMDVLGRLDPADLAALGQTSRAFYAYTHHDSLWRALVLRDFQGNFQFRQTWKQTWIDQHNGGADKSVTLNPIKVEGLYSDYLFQPWFCASMGVDPSWLKIDNIDRRSNLSLEEFVEEYEKPNRPVVITDVVTKWPAFEKWSLEHLVENYGDVMFRAGPVDISLKNYWTYATAVKEEAPIYLFDKKFGENAPQLAADYTVPEYFSEDLFSLLGSTRPDYRWIIIGPARSGSTFHLDPNKTSAWNAVVRGRKKWVFYPPGCTPPGVIPSEDGSDVATPVSINEWFSNFYKHTKSTDVKPIECIVEEGEVIFVPCGWWHIVVNLEDSIAITQNYVSRRNLAEVLEFLRDRPEDISGCGSAEAAYAMYDKFRTAFETKYPGELEEIEREYYAKRGKNGGKCCKETMWSKLTESADGSGAKETTFSFGF